MFVKVTKGQAAPITLAEFKKMHPQVSFPRELTPELLAKYGVYPARDMNRPTIDANQRATLSEAFTQVDGEWVREWTVRTLTQDEVRDGMVCSAYHLRLVMGESGIALLDVFANERRNSWSLRQVLNKPDRWERMSGDALVLQEALRKTDEEMDTLFVKAMGINNSANDNGG